MYNITLVIIFFITFDKERESKIDYKKMSISGSGTWNTFFTSNGSNSQRDASHPYKATDTVRCRRGSRSGHLYNGYSSPEEANMP